MTTTMTPTAPSPYTTTPSFEDTTTDGPTITTSTTNTKMTTTTAVSACTNNYVGDGYCDDENNIEVCNWDGGDCCNNNIQNWDEYCDDCQCFENGDGQTTPTTDGTHSPIPLTNY